MGERFEKLGRKIDLIKRFAREAGIKDVELLENEAIIDEVLAIDIEQLKLIWAYSPDWVWANYKLFGITDTEEQKLLKTELVPFKEKLIPLLETVKLLLKSN